MGDLMPLFSILMQKSKSILHKTTKNGVYENSNKKDLDYAFNSSHMHGVRERD